ncbi:MAG: YggS family pyridoxal phosphate-dependent enzyme [Clostridia bacterium]
MSIAENYECIRERMRRACSRAGRAENDVRLVAVSKYVDVDHIYEVVALGQRIFGENHAQELNEKKTFFEQNSCQAHFIGQLQTNKIKYVCGSVGLIESLDRISLIEPLQKKSVALGIISDVLIQVNIGGETQKGGIPSKDIGYFAQQILACANLRLRGLMCVPPALPPEKARPYFQKMRVLYEEIRRQYADAFLDTLSMGMSHDYEVAIEEGATEVRIGSALFGARNKQ